MTLLVGLGNVGGEYELTRHNAGFMLVDFLLKEQASVNLTSTKFKGELFKLGSLLLLKPSTFMNSSGVSVKAVVDFYKPERVVVAHDDLDLPLGALRFKNGGSSGGHNGIKSIDGLLGAGYDRIRIGIGRGEKTSVINFVLGKFEASEFEVLKRVLAHCAGAVSEFESGKSISEISSKWTLKGISTN